MLWEQRSCLASLKRGQNCRTVERALRTVILSGMNSLQHVPASSSGHMCMDQAAVSTKISQSLVSGPMTEDSVRCWRSAGVVPDWVLPAGFPGLRRGGESVSHKGFCLSERLSDRVQQLCESRLRWPSWAVRPNEPSGFRGRKDLLNHASALVTACP